MGRTLSAQAVLRIGFTTHTGGVNRPRRQPRPLPTSPFTREPVTPPSTAEFQVGDRVTWDRGGMGRVVAVDEDSIVVDFGTGVTRTFAAGAAGLSRL